MNTVLKQNCIVFLLIAVSVLSGCGSGGSGSGGSSGSSSQTNNVTVPVGIYFGTGNFVGTQTINGYTSSFNTSPYILGFVTSAGNYMLLSYTTGSPNIITHIDSGSSSALNGTLTSGNNVVSAMYPSGIPIYYPQGGTLSAVYVLNSNQTGQSISGTITYAGTQNASLALPLGYVGGDTMPATLAAVAKTFTGNFDANINTSGYGNLPPISSTFTISSSGVLTGTVTCQLNPISPPTNPTPCTVSGTVTPRSDLNAYDVSISFANGTSSLDSSFIGKTATGLGYYDSTSGNFMFGVIAPDNTAFAFSN